jgi:tRNA-binding EMAP/Myf-like protein
MEKVTYLYNGQWSLAKTEQPFQAGEIHELEVHPHIDHLYKVKTK